MERVFAGAKEGEQNPPSSPVAGEGVGERNIGRWATALLVVILGWRLRAGGCRHRRKPKEWVGEGDALVVLEREIVLGGDALMGEREGLDYIFS